MSKKFNSQDGILPIPILLAAVGILGFLLISNTFNFKDNLFARLFPKPASFAVDRLANPINVGVLVLRYFPLDSTGTILDVNETGMNTDLISIRNWVTNINGYGIQGMTDGSKYHGLKTNSVPYLNYFVSS